MRKKYENPATLTMNYSFDPKLLDLVANTYEMKTTNQEKKNSKRSFSEKKIVPLSTSYSSFAKNKIQRSQSCMRFFSGSKNEKNNFAKTCQSRYNVLNNRQSNKIAIANLDWKQMKLLTSKTQLQQGFPMISFNIDRQITKSMLKNIRKNILSANSQTLESGKLENTYKKFLTKLNKGYKQK